MWTNYVQEQFEVNDKPSMTIPDQTMSIREILTRYARGLPLGGGQDVYYDEEDEMPDIRTMDLTDIADMRDEYLQRKAMYDEKIEKAKSEKTKAKYRKEWEEEQKKLLITKKSENDENPETNGDVPK